MIELILATLIFIQSPQDLLRDCGHVDLTPTQTRYGCFVFKDNTIHILENQSQTQTYKTLYHEQGHNLFYNYPMPTIFRGEEHRADSFAVWMYEKKFAQPNTYLVQGSPMDRYFKAVCDSECVKAILDLKL